jgi:hypothetical protein
VVQFSVLAAQLTFLFNVDHLRVVDTDWSSHGLLPHDFVNKVQCMRWKLQALDRIFLGYWGVNVTYGFVICVSLSSNHDCDFSFFGWIRLGFVKSWASNGCYLGSGDMLRVLLHWVETTEVIFRNQLFFFACLWSLGSSLKGLQKCNLRVGYGLLVVRWRPLSHDGPCWYKEDYFGEKCRRPRMWLL